MRTLITVLFAMLVAGCVTTGGPATTITREAEKVKVDVDKRLLEPCNAGVEELKTGREEDIVAWAKDVLKSEAACRKTHTSLADWVKKTFKLD